MKRCKAKYIGNIKKCIILLSNFARFGQCHTFSQCSPLYGWRYFCLRFYYGGKAGNVCYLACRLLLSNMLKIWLYLILYYNSSIHITVIYTEPSKILALTGNIVHCFVGSGTDLRIAWLFLVCSTHKVGFSILASSIKIHALWFSNFHWLHRWAVLELYFLWSYQNFCKTSNYKFGDRLQKHGKIN